MSIYELAIPGTIFNETDLHVVQVNGVWQLAPGQNESDAYTNDPDDPGGPTKWGQSQRQLQIDTGQLWSAAEIQALSVDWVIQRWKPLYWFPIYEAIESQNVASKVFDIGIIAGPARAIMILQAALWASGHTIEIDGSFGPITLEAANSQEPQSLIDTISIRQADYFRGINNPAELHDWLVRAQYLATSGTIKGV